MMHNYSRDGSRVSATQVTMTIGTIVAATWEPPLLIVSDEITELASSRFKLEAAPAVPEREKMQAVRRKVFGPKQARWS